MEKNRVLIGERLSLALKCLFSAFLILSICSKSSFLYPINDWGDAGCYYIHGRGILEGMVPYRDLAEQKGPAIFFVYALGLLLSKSSFIGIFIIEVICSAIFLYYSIKLISLFGEVDNLEISIGLMLAASIYGSFTFRHGGGPEELSLCLFGYMLYLAMRYIVKDILPSRKEMVVLGICAGLLFWTKYTLCAMYIALLLMMLVHSVIIKNSANFWRSILFFILGCILISFPIILYFALNGAIEEFFVEYFYNNIFLYRQNDAMYSGFGANIKFAFKLFLKARNCLAVLLVLLGFAWALVKRQYELFMAIIISFIFTFIVINSGIVQYYGNLPLYVYSSFGICCIIGILDRIKQKSLLVLNCLSIVLSVIAAYVLCIHTYDLFKSKEDMPQYIFAKEMQTCGIDDYSMLYYGPLDQGFYFADGNMPKWKAFVQLNQGGDELTNMQNGYINNLEPDFIISEMVLCDSSDYDEIIQNHTRDYEKEVVAFDNFGYEQIDEQTYLYEEYDHIVRLYKKCDD